MRKSLFTLLAAVVVLLAAAPGFASPAAAAEPLLSPATATAEAAEMLPAEGTEGEVEEALPPEEALLPVEDLVPKPVPAWCPYNLHCNLFCPEYVDCEPPQCINHVCVYGW